VTVHFEQDGVPISLLLDIVEVACSHSGFNLAAAFAGILKDFGISDKILSVTCDNATANDTMIEELADLVEAFPGAPNRTRCFAHILNLVARCILKQFDLPNAKTARDLDERVAALIELAEDIDNEENMMDTSGDDEANDSEEGMTDPRVGMTEEEIAQLEESVHPVRLVLVKVSCSESTS
jgi:hypothetical protein